MNIIDRLSEFSLDTSKETAIVYEMVTPVKGWDGTFMGAKIGFCCSGALVPDWYRVPEFDEKFDFLFLECIGNAEIYEVISLPKHAWVMKRPYGLSVECNQFRLKIGHTFNHIQEGCEVIVALTQDELIKRVF